MVFIVPEPAVQFEKVFPVIFLEGLDPEPSVLLKPVIPDVPLQIIFEKLYILFVIRGKHESIARIYLKQRRNHTELTYRTFHGVDVLFAGDETSVTRCI